MEPILGMPLVGEPTPVLLVSDPPTIHVPVTQILQKVMAQGLPPEYLREIIRQLCRENYLIFQKLELGLEVGPHHHEWWEDLQTKEDVIEVSPRDHGKSHFFGRGVPLWAARYDPWIQEILILGPDKPTASESLEKLKDLLAGSKSLRYLIPSDRKTHFNSKTEIKLSNGVIIRAKGYWSNLRGRHPQLIILDDVLNEENCRTKEGRKKLRDRFFQVVYPMKDKGMPEMRAQGYKPQIIVTGTVQDSDDLYHELLKNPEFVGRMQDAIVDEKKEQTLWAVRYDYAALMKIKGAIGALSFSKEYRNKTLSEETSLFPPSLFEPLKDKTLSYTSTYKGSYPVYMGVDFSVPGDTSGDWTVSLAFYHETETDQYVLLWYWRDRPQLVREQLTRVEQMCRDLNVTSGYVEDNMFQKIYAEHFKRQTDLPIVGHTVNNTNKNSLATGVLSFRPLFENGKFRFPYQTPYDRQLTDHIVEEFNGVQRRGGAIGNFAFHDDCVMAMWHALSAAKRSTFEYSF